LGGLRVERQVDGRLYDDGIQSATPFVRGFAIP
jgi:hypothetical protein